jgi:multiple antibiotic resistance protein
MSVFANTYLLVYAALFPIVNPIGSAPLFLGLTPFATDARRNALALGVGINSFCLLVGSLLVGSHVLEFFGISLPVLRIGGGLVVAMFGWKMLNSDASPDGGHAAAAEAESSDAFYPLTMPLTVGPGSISVAVTLGSQRPEENLAHLVVLGSAAVAGILGIAMTIYLCYRFAPTIVSVLGKAGTAVVVRLSAFILLCIGIQILWGGIHGLMTLKP